MKTVLVTGANSGIGRAAATALAKRGAAVAVLCRDREHGEDAKKAIISASDNDQIDLLIADLSNRESIRRKRAVRRHRE